MSEATKKAKTNKPESAVRPTTFEPMSRLEQDMERMFREFWRRPFLSLWDHEHSWPGRTLSLVLIHCGHLKTLTLKGEKKKEEEVKEKNFYRSERSSGSFVRTIDLPTEVKTDQTKASFKNGVLEIRLPKTEDAKRKVTKVKID